MHVNILIAISGEQEYNFSFGEAHQQFIILGGGAGMDKNILWGTGMVCTIYCGLWNT